MDAQEQLGSFQLVVHLPSDYLVHSLNTSSLHTSQHAAGCTWLQVQTPSRRAFSCPWSSAFQFAIKAVPSGVKGNLEAAPLIAVQTRILNPDFAPGLGDFHPTTVASPILFSPGYSLS